MEQHPVPQNVTTFQFRLIGDMTIKQFGYLAAGAILAYVFYKLPLPFFFSWPLAFVFALGGFGFAFVPVEERPMDIWFLSFIKNVYNPTQFIWSQEIPHTPQTRPPTPAIIHPGVRANSAQPQIRPVADVVQGIFSPTATPKIAQTTKGPFDWLFTLFAPAHSGPIIQTPTLPLAPVTPTPSITGNHMDFTPPPTVTAAPVVTLDPIQIEKKRERLEIKTLELQKALEEKTQTTARILELQKQLTEVLSESDRMQKEISFLRTKVTPSNPPPSAVMTKSSVPHQPTVRIITPEGAIRAGLPRLTTFPNVVTGVIRDSDNNFLPGVLVTVRDKDGVPLRALKTNRLGQFAASTPIANGTYFVEIEDPRSRYIFDRVQITLNGSVVPGLEIFAKSHKQVSREKLAKEIFGS